MTAASLEGFDAIATTHIPIDAHDGQITLGEFLFLIAQKSAQRRNHHHGFFQNQRGNLIAGRLSKAGGENHQNITTRKDV